MLDIGNGKASKRRMNNSSYQDISKKSKFLVRLKELIIYSLKKYFNIEIICLIIYFLKT